MIYCRLITHTIQEGDTLYLLAKRYQTTVPAILLMNPGINPYNLPIGTRLKICMGDDNMRPQGPQMKEQEMWDDMRRAFTWNGNLSKMYLDSAVFGTANKDAVMERMMQNPNEIAEVFAGFYPREEVQKLQRLLSEHMMLVNAMMEKEVYDNPETLREEVSKLNQNARELANVFSMMNSFYDRERMEEMLMNHVASLERELMFMMEGNYEQALMVHEDMQEALKNMADYLADGIMRKFYQKPE